MFNPAVLDRVWREFHVSRECRDRYAFDDAFFASNGNVIFANFRAARLFAQRMNERRDVAHHPERAVRAGDINALGLVDEIMHYIIAQYRQQRNPAVMEEALAYLTDHVGGAAVEEMLTTFVSLFPPVAVYKGQVTVTDYLGDPGTGSEVRAAALEELLLLWLTNENPATHPYTELFDDTPLLRTQAYLALPSLLAGFFADQPVFGPAQQSLFEMLLSPARVAPNSLHDQLAFLRTRWGSVLGTYFTRLLSSLDFLDEEAKPFFGFGPGPAEVYEFVGMEAEPEAFSPDRDWMPRAVMIAKNAYVWLDQLTQAYGREIRHLDEVPDEELDRLRRLGFTALWLIGLWERSRASQRIKQMMGNPEAVASAYSITRYSVAEDLGGEAAFETLKARAWVRGIRMASDMVPNHMGIDSDWVINHPDWFVGLPYSPFPSYSYSGIDLCDDARVGVYLEDHYFQRTDAAVTFQRRDHWTGDVRYIYHGNDGTQMPWNDTAQLDYLNPEVREAVIQTILSVARRSPIIRFDAAMTLTKKHYQRLWFPEPGGGSDIASRADFGLTKAEFDARMPEEFWREVVDRVAAEVPDTLLLAEAFWLMEGYFVRSLGMHRVYNSAFMNMLRDEKNAEYRMAIKNTLEFDPEILRRYVNFMNNPDERTAVDQFGKGDKYFGVCTMMLTLPGLPMFGHGQIEGYAEKYGMEYRKAYWTEVPDSYLVERHERQIAPLLHRRYLFAGVDDYYLYDFFVPGGGVDENVFAYANRFGEERGLVFYNNRYGDTNGWVRLSAAYAVKDAEGNKTLVQKPLAEALGISGDDNHYLLFRDSVTGLEYIRNCRDLTERGLHMTLHAYQVCVFVDFREVEDDVEHHYGLLHSQLGGQGVPSIDAAMGELLMAPVLIPLRMLVSAPAFRWLVSHRADTPAAIDAGMLAEVRQKVLDVVQGARIVLAEAALPEVASEEDAEMVLDIASDASADSSAVDPGAADAAIADRAVERLSWVLAMPSILKTRAETTVSDTTIKAIDFLLRDWDDDDWARWGVLLEWSFTYALGDLEDTAARAGTASGLSRDWFDAWLLRQPLVKALEDLGVASDGCERAVAAMRMVLSASEWIVGEGEPESLAKADDLATMLRRALSHRDVQAFLGMNRYEGVLWFNREAFQAWLWWLLCIVVLRAPAADTRLDSVLSATYTWVKRLQIAEETAGYQVEQLLEAIDGDGGA